MNVYDKVSIGSIIDKIFEKNMQLSLGLLNRITGQGLNSYELIDILCNYINASKKVKENKNDIKAFCLMEKELKGLKAERDNLNCTLKSHLLSLVKQKQTEIELRDKLNAAQVENANLRCEIKDLQQELEIKRIMEVKQ